MSRPYSGLTIHEGYNELLTIQVDITSVEIENAPSKMVENKNVSAISRAQLFRLSCEGGEEMSINYRAVFSVSAISSEVTDYTLYPNPDGYIQLTTPILPITVLPDDETVKKIIPFRVNGILDNRQDESYLKVEVASETFLYTLIKDMVVDAGYLCIPDETGHFYKITPNISVPGGTKAVYISAIGEVAFYYAGAWHSPSLLTFYSITDPSHLHSVSDGFYDLSAGGGPVAWNLGQAGSPFIDYRAYNAAPENYFMDIHLEVFNGDASSPFYTGDFDLMPGSLNYQPVSIACPLPDTTDLSPDLAMIHTISGATFTGEFLTFMSGRHITTLNSIQKAGPIKSIIGVPPDPAIPVLQSHVDFYLINKDAHQNQAIMDAGYTTVYDIATTSKSTFLSDIGSTVPLYDAAQVHEVATQGQKFVSMVLAGTLGDYRMVDSPSPQISGSNFASNAFANNINACGCSDCKSMVSPFAYLMDLMRYCAERMDYTTSYDHNTPDYHAFIGILTGLFHQPFGGMSVTCDTLHDEYCRVRLVTEILETIVNATGLGPVASGTLDNARTNYLMLVYKGLLRSMGTSIEELRNIISIADNTTKTAATQKWADRIGITLYVDTSSVLTSDRLWLTFTATVSTQILNPTNLEDLFGYRSTGSLQVNPTLPAKILDWQKEKLKEIWKAQDYSLSSYSREDATSTSIPAANWKPIIDPDIIGITDMPYNTYGPAIKIWQARKFDTDQFLSYYHGTSVLLPDVLTRTSADISNRQIKVIGRNLLTQQLDNNEVEIQDSTPAWITFTVFSKAISQSDSILSLSKPTPAMIQPNGTTPKMRYRRVLSVPVGQTQTLTSFTITWPTEVIDDVLTSGYARLESSGDLTHVFATSGGTDSLSVTFPAGGKTATVTLGVAPLSTFANGNVTFVYEVEVPLFTAEIPDPEKTATKLFTRTETYSPALPAYDSALTYTVWATPAIAPWNTGISEYANLKFINSGIKNGTATVNYYTIITDYLHSTTEDFSRMMELMELCENYLASTFNSAQPTEDNLYEMVSLFRNSCKFSLRDYWIKEELRYSITVGGAAILLMLSGQNFWKPLMEPPTGAWDPRLQTIPELVANINNTHVPIIDPELFSKSDMLQYPINQVYLDLYDTRALTLSVQLGAFYTIWMPTYGLILFEKILNYVANANDAIPYNILPYTSLDDLLQQINSNDVFAQADALAVAWSVFRLSKEEFIAMMGVKSDYESVDPALTPSATELDKGLRLLVTAFKRRQLYNVTTTGWVQEEVAGSFTGGGGVILRYYNVFPMKLAEARGHASDRSEWQKTLADWNRQPFVNPDIIPPENIKNFITGDYAHDNWVSRKSAEDTLYTNLLATLTPVFPNTNATLFAHYQEQIDLLIARDSNSALTPIAGTPYLHYFTDIALKEANGEDITMVLDQLGFAIAEYRYLRKIYDYLLTATAGSAPSLLPEEYDDLANIMLRIRKRNLSFNYVADEYQNNIYLSDEYFVLYTPQQISFPQNTLPVVNVWRSSPSEQRDWTDTLEGRIERKQAISDKWKDLLIDVEDGCMPYLRDAYIEALRTPCETFNDAADRLSKTYFIETRDNCCVKHTRVSFAIETIQGLVFALQNGIYDEYASAFKLFAPYISQEWQWIGSYASWRSAVFVFIYPENLLYPTLKRLQSPKFQEIASKLQGATKVSPQDACDLGKEYTSYFNDIQDLQLICSTNTYAKPINDDPTGCCDEPIMNDCAITYFFGKAPSGQSYWAFKNVDDNSAEGLSFWEALPLRTDADPIGCFVFKDVNDSGVVLRNSLALFYTYLDNGKLTLAYLSKDISKSNTSWTDNKTSDLPTFKESSDNTYNAAYVVACQQSSDSRDPSFFVGYHSVWGNYNAHISFSRLTQKITPDKFDIDDQSIRPANNMVNKYLALSICYSPYFIAAISFRSDPTRSGGNYNTLALGFQYSVEFLSHGETRTKASFPVKQLMGLYELPGNEGKIVIFDYDFSTNTKRATIVQVYNDGTKVDYDHVVTIPNLDLSIDIQNIYQIFPVFASDTDFDRTFVAGTNANYGGMIGCDLDVDISSPSMSARSIFMPTPYGGYRQSVTSSECITDMQMRKLNIEQHITSNTNPPLGNMAPDYLCTTRQLECLIEAYYFVPMLLALDQQQRGQFEAALEWYRTVYDYTESISTNRKIYYGLTLEENIVNTYQHAGGWLLDPLNPHMIAKTRANSHTKYVLLNIIQCIFGYADRQYTLDTVETVPQARKLYSAGLDLLKAPELNVKTNACADISSACLSTGTILNSDPAWSAMFDKLQGLLNSYADPTTVQNMVNAVLAIFNGGGSITSKFTAAFNYLYAHPPGPGSSSTVNDLMVSLPDRMNDSYRYVLAFGNSGSFNQSVSDTFQTSVANVSGLPRSSVTSSGSTSQISWLGSEIPQTRSTYSTNFASSSGVQNLSRNPYNPLSPDNSSFDANVAYSNAPSTYSYQSQNQLAYNFIPLIDFNFCLPANSVYSSLVLRGNLELYKLFNCRNIAGMVRELDAYAAATDSTTGVPVIGAGGTLNVPGNKVFSPSQYRFKTLIERAKTLVGQSQQLESLFLAAMEKLDAENYNQTLARQGIETARSTVRLQDLRIAQANDETDVANLQLAKATFMEGNFATLSSEGISAYEQASLDSLGKSIHWLENARTAQIVAAVLQAGQAIASVFIMGGGAAAGVLGAAAGAASSVGGAYSTQSSIESTRSSIDSQKASYERRQQEWDYQANLARQDKSIAMSQIKVSQDNVRIVTQEHDIAQMNVDHAEETLNFLQTKFTNAALYSFMSGVLSSSYNYMLNVTTAVARTAEGQLYFERQEQAGPFILNDYWETPSSGGPGGSSDRRGLTGSARLLVDITKLEQYSFDLFKRKLQMTKIISIANNFPSEFQDFKESGVLNFQLTNKQFDYDFPGHYLRLVNEVKTSVIGLVPVYDGIKATLTAETISYTVIGGNTFQKIPIRRLEMDSVALTSTTNATGLFEMQPAQVDILNPFEGMGIESRWEFKLPQFSNRFDFNNIADVLITVNYTALDSYLYRYQVLQELDNTLTFNAPFSFRNDFPDQWFELSEAEAGTAPFGVTFEFTRNMFPQGILDLKLNKATDILLYFARKDGFVQEVTILDLSVSTPQSSTSYAGGATINGKFSATQLTNTILTGPVMKLRLLFDNTLENRKMFTDGSIEDIIVLVPCKAELKSYPM